MAFIAFLILFPLLPAVLLLLVESPAVRKGIIIISAIAIAVISVDMAFAAPKNAAQYVDSAFHYLDNILIAGELILACTILYLCRNLPFKKYWIPLMVVLQTGMILWTELSGKLHDVKTQHVFFYDNLSLIMAVIIGVIGTLICVYAVGYMNQYHHHHHEIPDRQKLFFFTMFLFLSAMFGIVFSDNLMWLYFFWEITTLCSFIMIGYSGTEEAVNNAFRALWMNLLGGLAFAIAIVYCVTVLKIVELDDLLNSGKSAAIILPVVLIAFAGLTKSAQFPFSGWLLGAMVAPTPVSALLHSSTMVKAGVYIIIKLAPAMLITIPGTMITSGMMIALIGAVSFLACSCLAISQSNAKRVLAYSTIANLGLIVLCAGVGSYLALWAAILLLIFHAVAKALLFLTVGTIEHQIGSRDIEDMHGLISKMPRITIIMLIGITGMFLAPFGMLVSKWAALEALAVSDPFLPIAVIFGSSATLFFWGKWMGKLIAITNVKSDAEGRICHEEWFVLSTLAAMTIAICALFPLVGTYFIEPLYGRDPILNKEHIIMVAILLGLVLLVPVAFFFNWKKLRNAEPYLCGAGIKDNFSQFTGSLGTKEWKLSNYYLEKYFGEAKLFKLSVVVSTVLIIITFTIVFYGAR
ncbi:MAG TPA: NADH-quinone oxidoreductase subunit L [Lentisphaeria bacterium]|nr:MAG: NADH dehydrogenase [Lentisphaerae bacterium GWF2_50_93]HCE46059.1 NADH-quinone oxidoreductase subunit L [Lentisphaeria bacterium]